MAKVRFIDIVPPGKTMSDEEVRDEINRRGYRPATPPEIDTAAKKQINKLRETRQAKLDKLRDGYLLIAVLEPPRYRGNPDFRIAVLGKDKCIYWRHDLWFINRYNERWVFPVVRKRKQLSHLVLRS